MRRAVALCANVSFSSASFEAGFRFINMNLAVGVVGESEGAGKKEGYDDQGDDYHPRTTEQLKHGVKEIANRYKPNHQPEATKEQNAVSSHGPPSVRFRPYGTLGTLKRSDVHSIEFV